MLPGDTLTAVTARCGPPVVRCAAPDVPEAFSANAARDRSVLMPPLLAAGHRLRRSHAQVIVVAAAVLSGLSTSLANHLAAPVFDGVACAVGLSHALIAHGRMPFGRELPQIE